MTKSRCPDKFVDMVRQFYEGMAAQGFNDSDATVAYSVSNDVKQGCVLAQTLLKLMFLVMLSDIFSGGHDNIYINNRTDGSFNLRRL